LFKSKSWSKLTNKIGEHGLQWKLFKVSKGNSLPPLGPIIYGSTPKDPQESVNNLAAFFKVTSGKDYINQFQKTDTDSLVHDFIISIPPKRDVPLSQVFTEAMIKQSGCLKAITAIFNFSWSAGLTPQLWKQATSNCYHLYYGANLRETCYQTSLVLDRRQSLSNTSWF